MKIAFRTLPALPLVAAMMLGSVMSNAASAGDDALKALDLRQVKVGGEIGRRIDVTVQNNLLVLDADKNFLAPFRTKETHEGYTGLGKLLDAAVRLAAYTHDQKVIAFKQRLVEQTIKVQEPDGYIGAMAAPNRMWGLWDIHEMGYIIYALTSDYHYFGQQRAWRPPAKRPIISSAAGRKSRPTGRKNTTGPPAWHSPASSERCWRSIAKAATAAISISASATEPCPTGRRALLSAAANRSKAIPIRISSAAWRNWNSAASSRTRSCCGSAAGAIALFDRPGRHDHHRRRGRVRNLDRRPGRPRGLGRDLLDGLPASPLRQPAAAGRQSALRRPDRADDLQRPVCRPVARRPADPLFRAHGRRAKVLSRATTIVAPAITAASWPTCRRWSTTARAAVWPSISTRRPRPRSTLDGGLKLKACGRRPIIPPRAAS